MKFICKKDGSCDLVFEEHEIKIITEQKKLIFTKLFFKEFSNTMMKVIMDWTVHIGDSELTENKDKDKDK
jgi:hypothetical protein